MFVRSTLELQQLLSCPADNPASVDLAHNALLISARTLSPAGMGTSVYDDGEVLTFVSRSRTTCPEDPLPMPMNVTLAVLLPAGAERTFKEASCTVVSRCR